MARVPLAAPISLLAALASAAAQVPSAPIDADGDGRAEVESIAPLAAAGDPAAPGVAVLVEHRVLDLDAAGELRSRLDRLIADLAAEGYRAESWSLRLAAGGGHRDGAIVLALRRALAERHARSPLAGALLVGHFPDAYLVRTVNWRKRGTVAAGGVKRDRAVPYLRRVAEAVAHRCDLVLADLDGAWEALYTEPRTELATVHAVFEGGVPARGGAADAVGRGVVAYRDFFHVDDGRITDAGAAILIDDSIRDLECTEADRARGNPLARPDIAVSRIDARAAAWSPRAALGSRPLVSADGVPQTVVLADGEPAPHWQRDLWVPDPELELRLLVEYLDRNHAYRTGASRVAFRPASIAHGLGSGMGALRAAAAEWTELDDRGYDLRRDADLAALVGWLRRPAVLRTMRAHSNALIAEFARGDPAALLAVLGGPPLCWTVASGRVEPALAPTTRAGRAGFFLYRTLWHNAALPPEPYLLIHTGCEAMSPPDAGRRSYDDPRYGAFAHAESLLFFTPCLAIVGRAKVFYDEPRGFAAALGRGETFGAAWRDYFEIESRAASWGQVGGDIGRKRSYFWSVAGDWTLRLRQGVR